MQPKFYMSLLILGILCVTEYCLISKKFNNDGLTSKFFLTEVEPSGLHFGSEAMKLKNTGEEMLNLIKSAKEIIIFASLYYTLFERAQPSQGPKYNDTVGRRIYDALATQASSGVKLFLIASLPKGTMTSYDIFDLQKEYPQTVNIKIVNMYNLTQHKDGVFHAKFICVDGKSFYLGSSNADYRAFFEIVEIGVFGYENPAVTGYLQRMAKEYFPNMNTSLFLDIKENSQNDKSSQFSKPRPVVFDPDTGLSGFIGISPEMTVQDPFDSDLSALLSVINNAHKYLLIAMMHYSCGSDFTRPKQYWDTVDRSIRRAVYERNIHVMMIVNLSCTKRDFHWEHALSLQAYKQIHVKRLVLPHSDSQMPPFSRLWHAKYAVSESEAWISTNNVESHYFNSSAGISFHITKDASMKQSVLEKLSGIFYKYWNSNYTVSISHWCQD